MFGFYTHTFSDPVALLNWKFAIHLVQFTTDSSALLIFKSQLEEILNFQKGDLLPWNHP